MAPTYEKVLVAIDGSEMSERVLEHVLLLAPIHDSEVIVYHVRQKAYAGTAILDVGPPPVVSPQEAAEELTRAGIRARYLEEDAYWGDTANAIVGAANREDAKVIMIGTRGLSKLPSVVLGSVAYKVLHLATQPVFVVP
jgi:nucleotide-binding universal stress UspA family protein